MKESALQQENTISSGRFADGVALLSSCRNLRVIADVRNSGNLRLERRRANDARERGAGGGWGGGRERSDERRR